jgi:hypothetical protein
MTVFNCHSLHLARTIWPPGQRFSAAVSSPFQDGPGDGSEVVRSLRILAIWQLAMGGLHLEIMSMDWFKGKSTGNHRFSHEDHGAFL